jgi:hypothetical protein
MSDQGEPVIENEQTDKVMKVWPTLFIGVGGTGMEIALRVRRRILNNVWGGSANPVRITSLTDFPLAQFINFDLDAGSVTESGKSAMSDPLSELVKFSDEEKVIFKLDMEKYLRTDGELNRFPHIASWFPLNRKKALELGIDPSKGAGQIRSLSRLYFFDKYDALRSLLEGKVGTLLAGVSSKAKTERLGLETEDSSLRVVVLASTAGGTGAGSFLDMGYLAKWIAHTKLKGAKVDLALMLPSGFSGHGKSRTEANTYGALMELETCMGQSATFIRGWKANEDPELTSKPFDEVFLFDTGNLANRKTAHATDVFDMVADILFEDFTSAEFANRKRSIAVNQNQYKIDSFSFPVDAAKYGKMRLVYSKAYSSFGQSIIDTQLEARRDEIACCQVNDMLKVFFGVASDSTGGREVPPPTPEDGRKLLQENAFCGRDVLRLAYKFVSDAVPYSEGIEYGMLKLLDQLISTDDVPMLGQLHVQIEREMNEITTTEKDQRQSRIDAYRQSLDRDLGLEGGATDAGARGLENAIKARRNVVLQRIMSEEGGLFKALWAAVDNKEKGGLEYTIQLIERVKDLIENDSTGLICNLEEAQTWFSGLCEKIRKNELQVLTERLQQTKGRAWLGNKDAHAESLLQQISEAIRWYSEARLREIACREGIQLLKDVSAGLGQHQGLDAKTNRKRWSANSFAGKLQGYEKLVVDIMHDMNEEVTRTLEATKQGHAAYQLVKVSTAELDAARSLDPKKAMEWAKLVFDNLGGSKSIFRKLESEPSKSQLIGQLRTLALSKLPSIKGGHENPLIKALTDMDAGARRSLFQHCLSMAMPWVEANLEGVWTVNPDQYSCVIGVNGADVFESKFGDEFRSSLPASARMTVTKLKFYETGNPGKLTAYIELSGVPLPALNMLGNWRTSYNEESRKIPVHTHKDKTLFVHPMAPNSATLDRLADHFKLFLQGIVVGALRAREEEPGDREYCFIDSGEELSIGNERAIRMEGIAVDHLASLQRKVANMLERINSPHQLAGLVALYDYYAKKVYPKVKIKDEKKVEFLEEGFCNVMCNLLRKEAATQLSKRAVATGVDATDLLYRLKGTNDNDQFDDFSTLNIWTEEIPGSDSDVYPNEVGRNHFPKRIFKQEFFKAGWLEAKFPENSGTATSVSYQSPSQTQYQSPSPSGSGGPPPLPVTVQVYVALNGTQAGPFDLVSVRQMCQAGQVTRDSLVWIEGMPTWAPAATVEATRSLFAGPPPLPVNSEW